MIEGSYDVPLGEAILLFVGLLSILVADLSKDFQRIATGRSMLILSVLAWYGLEAIQAPEEVRAYGVESYRYALFLVFLASATALCSYHAAEPKWFDDLTERVLAIESARSVWILFVSGTAIGLFVMALFVDFHLSAFLEGLTGLQRRWTDPFQRGRYGGFRDALLELTMFMRAVVPLGALIVLSRKFSATQRVVAALLMTWLVIRAGTSGNRSQVLPLVLPIAAAVYYRATIPIRKQLVLLGLPILAFAAFYYSAYVVAARNEGRLTNEQSIGDYVGFEMFRELQYISGNVPETIAFQKGRTYYVQLVNPIPRFLWPSKPSADAGLLLAEAKGAVDESGEATLTNSPGFIGEAYLNFGVFGIVAVSAFAGLTVRAWDRLYSISSRSFLCFVVYSAGLCIIFLSGRSFNMSTFYGVLALYVLLVAMQLFGSRRSDPSTAPPSVSAW